MKKILESLYSLQDEKYRDFQSKLIPNIPKDKIIGVRIPALRKLAGEMVKNGEYKQFIKELPHSYYDEDMLHACILSGIKDLDELIREIDRFLPYVDNWATNDSIRPKAFARDPDRILNKVKEWLSTKDEYYIRFSLVTLLNFYVRDNFRDEINELACSIKSDDYYVNMALAWYFSYALIYQYDATIHLLEKKCLSPWVHNKTIQKAIESYRLSDEVKSYLKSLKIR